MSSRSLSTSAFAIITTGAVLPLTQYPINWGFTERGQQAGAEVALVADGVGGVDEVDQVRLAHGAGRRGRCRAAGRTLLRKARRRAAQGRTSSATGGNLRGHVLLVLDF